MTMLGTEHTRKGRRGWSRARLAILLALFCRSIASHPAPAGAEGLRPESPRLKKLAEELETEAAGALDAFWREVSAQGAPLVEPLPSNDRQRLVTFLWRGREDTRNVAVVGGVVPSWAYNKKDGPEQLMTRLPGTDLWYKSYRVRSDARVTYLLSPDDPLVEGERSPTWQIDPLNPNRFDYERDPDNPQSVHVTPAVSVLSLPDAPPPRWTRERADVAHGRVDLTRIESAILRNERRLWVYTPPGYTSAGRRYPLVVFFDGWEYLHWIPTPRILDNLLAEGRVPPVVAVFVDTVPHRGELACYPPFGDFLRNELIPRVRAQYRVTNDPRQTVITGTSLGGLGAACYAFESPDVFGKVLSQSGSFWWSPPQMWPPRPAPALRADEEPEWLSRRIASSPRKRLDFYVEIGLLEQGGVPPMLTVNRHLRDVLQARGYNVRYSEFNGRHDFPCWRETLGDGLIALLGRPASR